MQAESGLSIAKFCEREGIKQGTFYAWRRRLKRQREAGEGRGDWPEGGEKAKESPRLVPVRLLEDNGPTAVEVVSPKGLTLRVRDDADTQNVRRVLQLMHELA
jgi:transposase-like protein